MIGKLQALQRGTIRKGVCADLRDRIGNIRGYKRRAALKGIRADGLQPRGKLHVFQFGAVFESVFTDFPNVFAEDDARYGIVVGKRAFADRRNGKPAVCIADHDLRAGKPRAHDFVFRIGIDEL